MLTLVFGARAPQHAALARIECFYESEKHANEYLTWEQARAARICASYEAFNFPAAAAASWLAAMRQAVGTTEAPATAQGDTSSAADGEFTAWWHAHCSPEECELLSALQAHGVLDSDGALVVPAQHTYLVSALVASAGPALAHERLHALYYLSPTYRTLLDELWASMPSLIASAVEYDMKMRGYKESVWRDELGAYLGIRTPATGSRRDDPAHEFGNKCAPTCAEIRRTLLTSIPTCWRNDVGLEEEQLVLAPAFLDQARAALAPSPRSAAPRRAAKPRK